MVALPDSSAAGTEYPPAAGSLDCTFAVGKTCAAVASAEIVVACLGQAGTFVASFVEADSQSAVPVAAVDRTRTVFEAGIQAPRPREEVAAIQSCLGRFAAEELQDVVVAVLSAAVAIAAAADILSAVAVDTLSAVTATGGLRVPKQQFCRKWLGSRLALQTALSG